MMGGASRNVLGASGTRISEVMNVHVQLGLALEEAMIWASRLGSSVR